MAFDAFYLTAVLEEIRRLPEPRVEKIHQPSRDTVLLQLRHREGRCKLLFGMNPTAPRLHLTATNPENPPEPPMFCMLLRKHLSGGRLVDIAQPPMERCAIFTFECVDEMGDLTQRKLIAELMGRTCNLYLLSPEGRIIDCLRRIGLDESAKRQALPGLYYQNPEPVEKSNPLTLETEDYVNLLSQPGADLLAQRLMDCLGGLSPLVCREAALFAANDVDARLENQEISQIAQKLALFFKEHLAHPTPCLFLQDDVPKQFAFCPLRQYGVWEQENSFWELLDRFYTLRDRKDVMRQKSQGVRKTVQNLCSRLTKKLAIQEKERQETLDRERLRQLGDILTANLHKISKGQTVVQAEDFYDENMTLIDIPLSPLLSPQQNAAKFYKDYARMKTAEKELTRQLEIGQQELVYLKSVLEELNRADTDQALEEIKQELQTGGYLRPDNGKKRMKSGKMPPLRFESTDGFPIFVGRNNRQNEELTFKMAGKGDIWLHASKVPGSHVIIACGGQNVPDDTITQAAQLAAHYAETAGGQNIPVDVTPVRQVKKIPNGKPGMVIYHTYRTVIVNPYPDIVVDALNAEHKPEE
ncbi:MAG: fibronectin/fibrinogen-binding protein [Ruminococcaceae bacterium]|nr:fibronectin/fibrinogen-binding protein [Oscillospiraceae bacterium]